MPIYNKLVRGKISQIIAETGGKYKTKVLSDEEYITALREKSLEELNEYLQANHREAVLEELEDLLEILPEYHDFSTEEMEEIRQKKTEKSGPFREKILLIEVEN